MIERETFKAFADTRLDAPASDGDQPVIGFMPECTAMLRIGDPGASEGSAGACIVIVGGIPDAMACVPRGAGVGIGTLTPSIAAIIV